ncbi:MAG: hypothetical protein ACRDZO_09040 [Egibacteraceae bacterium]
MSPLSTAAQPTATRKDYEPPNPYRDAELVHLVETLEAQHNRNERFNEDIVWELVNRAAWAERHRRQTPKGPSPIVQRIKRPYGEDASVDLVERLERQYDQGRPLDPALVFEMVNRALKAEAELAARGA